VRINGSDSKSAEQNQYQDDDQDEPETATAIIAGSIKAAPADAAESTQQRDYHNNEYDHSYRHQMVSQERATSLCARWIALSTGGYATVCIQLNNMNRVNEVK
jgi:hypothetical protein